LYHKCLNDFRFSLRESGEELHNRHFERKLSVISRFKFKTTLLNDMNNQNDIPKRHDIGSLFKTPTEKALFACLKKMEKIVTAIHLVTDVMEPQVMVSRELENQSLILLAQFYEVFERDTPDKETALQILVKIGHLLSLITMGLVTRHISPMNATMLTGELEKVSKIITEEIKTLDEYEKSFATFPSLDHQPLLPDVLFRDADFAEAFSRSESKRHQNDIKTTLMRKNDISKKLDRKSLILEAIKSREESTIHDIKKLFPDISEKTLQRELNSLMEMNIIKKEGNKRWTVYRLVKSS